VVIGDDERVGAAVTPEMVDGLVAVNAIVAFTARGVLDPPPVGYADVVLHQIVEAHDLRPRNPLVDARSTAKIEIVRRGETVGEALCRVVSVHDREIGLLRQQRRIGPGQGRVIRAPATRAAVGTLAQVDDGRRVVAGQVERVVAGRVPDGEDGGHLANFEAHGLVCDTGGRVEAIGIVTCPRARLTTIYLLRPPDAVPHR